MKKRKGYLIFAIIFAVLGAFLKFALMGYDFLGYGCFAAALMILFFAALNAEEKKWPKLCRALRKITVSAICVFLIAITVTELVIITDRSRDSHPDAEYVIVLGAGVNGTEPSLALWLRLEAALEYAERYPEAKLVVSGGRGDGEDITEAECMAKWLIKHGVTAERIILEEKAASTLENIEYSKELILTDNPGFSGKICIITSGYHVFRARMMAEDMGLNIYAYPADSGLPLLTVNYYFREAFAVWYYMITR